jgi:hypothetical protein
MYMITSKTMASKGTAIVAIHFTSYVGGGDIQHEGAASSRFKLKNDNACRVRSITIGHLTRVRAKRANTWK